MVAHIVARVARSVEPSIDNHGIGAARSAARSTADTHGHDKLIRERNLELASRLSPALRNRNSVGSAQAPRAGAARRGPGTSPVSGQLRFTIRGPSRSRSRCSRAHDRTPLSVRHAARSHRLGRRASELPAQDTHGAARPDALGAQMGRDIAISQAQREPVRHVRGRPRRHVDRRRRRHGHCGGAHRERSQGHCSHR